MNRLAFWTKARDYAAGKVRTAYMDRYGHDRLCPNCRRWISETDGAKAVREDGPFHEIMTCSACDADSRWDCRGMLPVWSPVDTTAEASHD